MSETKKWMESAYAQFRLASRRRLGVRRRRKTNAIRLLPFARSRSKSHEQRNEACVSLES